MKKSLYVHIGPSKAGSSTIRAFLAANATRLHELGRHCQSSAFAAAHGWLRRPLEDLLDSPLCGALRQWNHWRVEDDAAAYQEERAAFSRVESPSVVLSSQFFSLASSPQRIFADIAFESGVAILAIRSQIAVASSLIRELTREGDVDFERAQATAMVYDMDWLAIANRWSAIAGFRPTRFVAVSPPGHLLRDLLHSLDVPPEPEGWAMVPSANVGLPASVVRYLYRRKRSASTLMFSRVVEFFLAHPTLRALPDGDLLEPDMREMLIRRHREGNALLVAAFPRLADALRHPSPRPDASIPRDVEARLDRLYRLGEMAAVRADEESFAAPSQRFCGIRPADTVGH